MKAQFNLRFKARGFFRLQTFTEDGVETQDTGFFENLITNQGLDQVGLSPYVGAGGARYINTYSAVGTGTTPPAFTDTQLTSFLAQYPTSVGAGQEGSNTSSYNAGPPTYWSQIWQYTYPTGAAAGNLSEVGVGVFVAGDTQPELFSHALIVDGGGSPTTITVTSSQILILTYELRLYPTTTDTSYSFTLTDSTGGSVTESGIFRPSDITIVPFYYRDMSDSIGTDVQFLMYTGSIGPTTGVPSGSSFNAASGSGYGGVSGAAYVPGTYYKSFTASINTTAPRNTYNCIVVKTDWGNWQFSVSPGIALTAGLSAQFVFNVSWARY